MPRGPNVLCAPPKPRKDERIHTIAAIGREDTDEVLARVRGWNITSCHWSHRIIGRPVRVGQRWHFVVRVP